MRKSIVIMFAMMISYQLNSETISNTTTHTYSSHSSSKTITRSSSSSSRSSHGKQIIGSGRSLKQFRNVRKFKNLSLNTSADVIVSYGKVPSLYIVADDNVVPLISTYVYNGCLSINNTGNYSSKLGVKVYIVAPQITKVTTNAAGNLSIKTSQQNTMIFSLNGSGNIEATGTVDRLHANINGSGNLELKNLKSRNCDVSIRGSGSAFLQVTNFLKANISGSGDIRYFGYPTVSSIVNGSGELKFELPKNK